MFDNAVLENLEEIPPGAELGRVLASLPWEHLSGDELVRVLQAQDRQVAHYQAARAWTMNQIVEEYEEVGRGWAVNKEVEDGAAAEIGAALRLTRRASQDQTKFAIAICKHRPRVFEELVFGRIDLARAKILVEPTLVMSVAAAEEVLEQILPDAGHLTSGQLRHRLQKLCMNVDPQAARKRYERCHENRRVVLEATGSGTADLKGLDLDPEQAAEIKTWIHQEALKLRRLGDRRTMDQLRADIYVDLLRRSYLGRRGFGRRGGVHIDLTLEMLAKLSDACGEIEGFGPVTDDIARQIVAHQINSEWTWTLRDPATEQPIDGGVIRRRPTTAQRRFVHAHHRTCSHPGCRMPAVDCDVDHRVPWQERRVTCTSSLAPLCRHHHVIRHTWGWSYQPHTGGDWLFTSPLRHLHTTSGKPP